MRLLFRQCLHACVTCRIYAKQTIEFKFTALQEISDVDSLRNI